MEYTYIKRIKGFKELEQFGLNILQESISNFLSCDVQIFTDPLNEMKKYNIDIFENEKRGLYSINEDKVILIGRILEDSKMISSIGLRISKIGISNSGRFLTILEGALTNSLTNDYFGGFKNCKYLLGDELIFHAITNYFSKGFYDYRHIRHLINYFNKLRTTSFEGSYFSTGLILTKSHYAYNKKGDDNRFGETFSLKKSISLANTNKVNRRFWYLVDGKRSFFMANKSLVLTQLFIINQEYQNATYLDSHTLAKSLKGGDLLFKLENEKLLSIINSDNIEISYFENQWKFRDYNFIRDLFSEHFSGNIELIESLLFYIIYCSKNSISSIIWLPKDIKRTDKLIKSNTKNRLLKVAIPINNKAFTNHVLRYLSSDGATIIDKEGYIQNFGCIIDLSKIKISGLKGTGESAASALGSNGISIKVSQDGTIKVFKKGPSPIII